MEGRDQYDDSGDDGLPTLTAGDHITTFLDETGEDAVLSSYRELEDQYGDRLEPELTVTVAGEAASYHLQVHNELERKGLRSGKGNQFVSRLLGRRHSWPQGWDGLVTAEDVDTAYSNIMDTYDEEEL